MVQWLALASLLGAASAPATFLLQRDLNFRALGLIQLASYAAGYLGVGVPMALSGYGAHSLAVACVVQSAVTLVAAYAARPHSLRPLFSHSGGAASLVTGRAVFLTNVVNWLLSNLDRVVHRAGAECARGRPVQRGIQPRLDSQRAVAGRIAAHVPGGRGEASAGAAAAGARMAVGPGVHPGADHARRGGLRAAVRGPRAPAVWRRPGWTPPGSWRCCFCACPPGPAGGFPHRCCGTPAASTRNSCCSCPCWPSRFRHGGCLRRPEYAASRSSPRSSSSPAPS